MKKFSDYINEINSNKKLKKNIVLLTVVTVGFLSVLIFKPNENNSTYIVDHKGNLIGIERASVNKIENYKLELSVVNDRNIQNRKVEIIKKPKKQNNSKSKNSKKEGYSRENEILEMINEIELSNNRHINLPSKLSDGSKLVWEKENESYIKYFIIPLVYFLLFFLLVKENLDKEKNKDSKDRSEILRGLPRFVNQLLLMMNAGMILSDAFEQISRSYQLLIEKSVFEEELIEVAESNKEHRISTAAVINEWASSHNVKELMRISTILTENERRGSDVIDNLSRESQYLWDDRKIIAREKGKMIDTKMSYPMGLLLLLLIIITMAPAILNM